MKRFFAYVLLFVLLFASTGCSRQPVLQESVDTAMGTVIIQQLYTTGKEEKTTQMIALLKDLETNELSRRLETSELYAINENAGDETPLSDEMAEILEQCRQMWMLSEGKLDVTICPLVEAWNIDSWAAGEMSGNYQVPAQEEIEKLIKLCGSDKLTLDLEKRPATLKMESGMQIDLGAVGKGIAMDRIAAWLLEQEEIKAGVVSVGGSILTYGQKPDRQPWKIGITDPDDTSQKKCMLQFSGEWFLSTSGDYERYIEVDGKRIHHILDPSTGYPADSGVRSVTILSKNGFLSDALSTACFILGVDRGTSLVQQFKDTEVLFLLSDGSTVMSDGMRQYYVP